tara:strand:- start:1901 stop:2086 length:186 start_codon:yes stop_codon:yes gene_type:complete
LSPFWTVWSAAVAAKNREVAAILGTGRNAAARGAVKGLEVNLGVARAMALVAVDRTACIVT